MLLDKCGSLLIQMSTIAAIFALNPLAYKEGEGEREGKMRTRCAQRDRNGKWAGGLKIAGP